MNSPIGEKQVLEEKKENKSWSLEEKQLFIEGFNKHYKQFGPIAEKVFILKAIIIFV